MTARLQRITDLLGEAYGLADDGGSRSWEGFRAMLPTLYRLRRILGLVIAEIELGKARRLGRHGRRCPTAAVMAAQAEELAAKGLV